MSHQKYYQLKFSNFGLWYEMTNRITEVINFYVHEKCKKKKKN